MKLTMSTLAQGAKAVIGDTEFEVHYEMDPDVGLRLPDYTSIQASVGLSGMYTDPAKRGHPGRFWHYPDGSSRSVFLLGGQELWGQSILRPGASRDDVDGFLLALWTWDPGPDRRLRDDEWACGMSMPHRLAMLKIIKTWAGGGDDKAATFMARMAHGVTVRWRVGLIWPPCPNTDTDMTERCECGDEHWAPWS